MHEKNIGLYIFIYNIILDGDEFIKQMRETLALLGANHYWELKSFHELKKLNHKKLIVL